MTDEIIDLIQGMFIDLLGHLPNSYCADYLPRLLDLGIAPTKEELDEWLWMEDYEDTYDAVVEAWEREHGKVSD